jgi:6-phosphogluconolactonase (cycloisomerase 2 family)
MRHTLQRYGAAAALAVAMLLPLIGTAAPATAGPRITGAVYSLTNAASGNAIAVFLRDVGGRLHPAGTVSTGGTGTGAGLGSQGALAVAGGGRWLLAVNAGSNTVSALKITMTLGLQWMNTVSSGGTEPVSVAAQGSLVYVVNAGSDNIRGFRLGAGGLHPIPGSTRPLSGSGVGPAQISFGLGGKILAVTEKATNLIDTYRVKASGRATGPATHPSAGQTPFGFVFAGRFLVPTEAFGGTGGASAVSSYAVSSTGAVKLLSASVPNGQTAVCWAALSPNRRDIVVANTGSNTVSRYTIDAAGLLRLREAVAGTTGAAPADDTFSPDGRFLYVLDGGDGTITAFRAHGVLMPIQGATGLPTSAAGLVSV